jgi:hypothetical protein
MWFIDSWAVVDGLAFASKRNPDSIDASTTVFLSVPDIEPIPIGRISTALRAQRSSFQDGFRDDDGNEIGFETLDQIRELIRRAYLGGGLGPTPAPAERPPLSPLKTELERSPFEGVLRPGGEYYAERLGQIDKHAKVWIDYSAMARRETRTPLLERLHISGDSLALYPYLRAFGEAALLELWQLQAYMHIPRLRHDVVRWLRTLVGIGLWDTVDDYLAFVREADLAGVLEHIHRSPGLTFDLLSEPGALPLDGRDLLLRMPCPLLDEWYPHIQVLGHKLLLPLVASDYFEVNRWLPEFIPSLFCSLVVVSTRELAVSSSPRLRVGDRRRLLGRAMQWLDEEMPDMLLAPGVEAALTKYAWQQLGLNPPRRPVA